MYPLDQYDLPHQKHSTLNYLPPMDLSASENVSNASAKNVAANDGSTGEAATQMGNGMSDRIVATPLSLPSSSEVAAGSSGAVPPAVDYTPPEYITLLLTDLGVLTPSGVSDELIKLYY